MEKCSSGGTGQHKSTTSEDTHAWRWKYTDYVVLSIQLFLQKLHTTTAMSAKLSLQPQLFENVYDIVICNVFTHGFIS